jgi:hypothetical protein
MRGHDHRAMSEIMIILPGASVIKSDKIDVMKMMKRFL